MSKQIFNLQRFQILQAKLNPATSNLVPDYYAYAWYKKVYPFFEEEKLHVDLKDFFSTTENQIDEISRYADDEWLNGSLYNFYEYETKYQCRANPVLDISRHTLIHVFRYSYLKGMFDDAFWNKLLEPMNHPTEASSITRDFDINNIYLI